MSDITTQRWAILSMLPLLDAIELAQIYTKVKALTAYRDITQPERKCDHCGQPYRGPAVFCSLRCAEAEA